MKKSFVLLDYVPLLINAHFHSLNLGLYLRTPHASEMTDSLGQEIRVLQLN